MSNNVIKMKEYVQEKIDGRKIKLSDLGLEKESLDYVKSPKCNCGCGGESYALLDGEDEITTFMINMSECYCDCEKFMSLVFNLDNSVYVLHKETCQIGLISGCSGVRDYIQESVSKYGIQHMLILNEINNGTYQFVTK